MKDLLAPDDTRDALRKHGGLLLGIGVLMLLIRKGDDMGDFVVFLLLAAPAILLYGGGVFTDQFTGGTRPWQGVFSVFGLIFVPLALSQLVTVIGDPGDAGKELNVFWIFGVTAALAFYAGIVKGIRFHILAGTLATFVAWTALWNKLLGDGGVLDDVAVYRGLLGLLAIGFLVAGLYLWRRGGREHVAGTGVSDGGDYGLWRASEFLTGAGITAIIACGVLTAASFAGAGIAGVVSGPFGEASPSQFIGTAQIWDVLLLVISLGLIGLGSQIGTRGPVYVGGIGLALFLFVVGADLNEGVDADPRNLGIWPIILLVGGGLLVALSAVKEASLGDQPKKFVNSLKK